MAKRRSFLFILMDQSRGFGPKDTPPPGLSGVREEPARALPVPFCLNGFLPPPRTSLLVSVLAVPYSSETRVRTEPIVSLLALSRIANPRIVSHPSLSPPPPSSSSVNPPRPSNKQQGFTPQSHRRRPHPRDARRRTDGPPNARRNRNEENSLARSQPARVVKPLSIRYRASATHRVSGFRAPRAWPMMPIRPTQLCRRVPAHAVRSRRARCRRKKTNIYFIRDRDRDRDRRRRRTHPARVLSDHDDVFVHQTLRDFRAGDTKREVGVARLCAVETDAGDRRRARGHHASRRRRRLVVGVRRRRKRGAGHRRARAHRKSTKHPLQSWGEVTSVPGGCGWVGDVGVVPGWIVLYWIRYGPKIDNIQLY